MNVRSTKSYHGLVSIIAIACIGLPVVQALWIPIPRNNNRIPQLVRTVNPPRQSQKSAPVKRDQALLTESSGSEASGTADIAYAVDGAPDQSSDQVQSLPTIEADDSYDEMETSWPITPRACLVLMKILYAQTAEAIERGNSDGDFYEVASYYQPAIRTISKCMNMADLGYENVISD